MPTFCHKIMVVMKIESMLPHNLSLILNGMKNEIGLNFMITMIFSQKLGEPILMQQCT